MKRKQVIFDFRRFFTILKNHPEADRHEMVYNATHGETDDIKLLTEEEYKALCEKLEGKDKAKVEWKSAGSNLLHLLQLIGVNTADWDTVDEYLKNPRIYSGICPYPKRYKETTTEERELIKKKIHSILDKDKAKGIDRSIPKYKLN